MTSASSPVLSFAATLVLAVILPTAARAAERTYTLTVVAEGVSNSKGVVGVLVFRSSAGWPERSAAAFRARAVPARPGSTAVTVTGLPAGTYAVVVLHDENENMKLDRNWMGIPKEQWGMSRNPPVDLSAPRFEQAEFSLRNNVQIHVALH